MRTELYLDSSGDFGLKFGRGSSSHVSLVVARLSNPVAFTSSMVVLRRREGLPNHYEFHYAKIRPATRAAYFVELARLGFEAWGVCVDKRTLPNEYRRCHSDELLCRLAGEVAARIPEDVIAGATLVVDDKQERTKASQAVRVAVSRVLEGRQMKKRLGGARGLPAHRSDGLQLADMLAGALRESRAGKGGPDHLSDLGRKIHTLDDLG